MTRKEYVLSKKLAFDGLCDPEKDADPSFCAHVDAIEKAIDEFEYLYLDVGPDKYVS